jgi:hypothetical protein
MSLPGWFLSVCLATYKKDSEIMDDIIGDIVVFIKFDVKNHASAVEIRARC